MNSQNSMEQNPVPLPQHIQAQPHPNRLSVFANNQFGCGQQPQTLLSHNHHHPQCTPNVTTSSPSPVPTTTSNCHQPPSTTTARLNPARTRRQRHITAQEQSNHATSPDERAPTRCHIAHSDVAAR